MSYYGYNNYPPQEQSSFSSGFSGCLGVGCGIVSLVFVGFVLMGVFFTVAVLNS